MRVGIVGGGQLGRMLALAAHPLGIAVTTLDPAETSPAAQVAPAIVGGYGDLGSLERLARASDVATYEFENVPVEAASFLADRVPVRPGPEALAAAQDRLAEKTLFEAVGLPVPPFAAVHDLESLRAAIDDVGLPAVLKTRRLGYDGKGQAVLRDALRADDAWRAVGEQPSILERFVPFRRELSVVAARGVDGAVAAYPLVENEHRDGILRVSRAPADVDEATRAAAEGHARAVLERLGYVGVLAIELFDVDGGLLGNEMAPRVHNSGHWTTEGAVTSQFEQHLRAVCGLPLGDASPRGSSGMVNLIGAAPSREDVLAVPGAHLHLYGKQPRPGRKIGHVTVVAQDHARRENALERLLPSIREV
ncbi:MAG TPA: 5-(carboxyamino)imidazole ribonucleotide synthase [Actinomycetota bacterium]|nr:5-(carboxyamino)imidazole ribonucleotide synthase [Actinomycetota bacterium]